MRPCSRTAVGVADTMSFSLPSPPPPSLPPVVNCSVRNAVIDDTTDEALEPAQSKLVSGFAPALDVLDGEPLSDSETSSSSSSSGSSAVGAYAMYALNENYSADEAAGFGRSPLPPSSATRHDDCLLFANTDDDGLCRMGRETGEFFRSAQRGINSGRSAAVPATRSLSNKVRALSSECLEGLGWGEGRGGRKGHWRGRSESEPRLPGPMPPFPSTAVDGTSRHEGYLLRLPPLSFTKQQQQTCHSSSSVFAVQNRVCCIKQSVTRTDPARSIVPHAVRSLAELRGVRPELSGLREAEFFDDVSGAPSDREHRFSLFQQYSSEASAPPKEVLQGFKVNCVALDKRSWLEVRDKHHRYGKNLRLYFKEWDRQGEPGGSFFKWLSTPDVQLEGCPRQELESDVVHYCRPEERENYALRLDVTPEGRAILHTSQGEPVDCGTNAWLFVLRDQTIFATGKKTDPPRFHHSSFFGGGYVEAAGMLGAVNGMLVTLYPHSGHYRPTNLHLHRLLLFLRGLGVDLSAIQVDAQRVHKVARPDKRTERRVRKMDNPFMVSGLYLLDFFEMKHRAWSSDLFGEFCRKVIERHDRLHHVADGSCCGGGGADWGSEIASVQAEDGSDEVGGASAFVGGGGGDGVTVTARGDGVTGCDRGGGGGGGGGGPAGETVESIANLGRGSSGAGSGGRESTEGSAGGGAVMKPSLVLP